MKKQHEFALNNKFTNGAPYYWLPAPQTILPTNQNNFD